MNNFNRWFDTYINEKHPPYAIWEIADSGGNTHIIDTELVIHTIKKNTSPDDQTRIKKIIAKIDFYHTDLNHFFRHLAQGMVDEYDREVS